MNLKNHKTKILKKFAGSLLVLRSGQKDALEEKDQEWLLENFPKRKPTSFFKFLDDRCLIYCAENNKTQINKILEYFECDVVF